MSVQVRDLISDIRNGKHEAALVRHLAKLCGDGSFFGLMRQLQEVVDMTAKVFCLHHVDGTPKILFINRRQPA
jgi:hypothetical protein